MRRSFALIVYKKSLWTLQRQPRSRPRALPPAQWAEWRRSHAAHTATLRHVIRTLRQAHIPFALQYRARMRPVRRATLVITVGGDGTFLRASHYVRALPMFGVNSNPASSVGFFCCATRATFHARLRAYLRGRLPVTRLTRLAVRLNGRRLPELALNDALITHENPAATARYLVRVRGRKEVQASSGLWIATPAGSTAAARSAGGWTLPLTARQLEFVVREPFVQGKRPIRLRRGRVSATSELRVLSLMPAGRLYLDGPHVAYPLRWGDRAVFRAGTPVRVVGIPRRVGKHR